MLLIISLMIAVIATVIISAAQSILSLGFLLLSLSYCCYLFLQRVRIEGKQLKAQIWDTAGQERYRSITDAFVLEDAIVVLLSLFIRSLVSCLLLFPSNII